MVRIKQWIGRTGNTLFQYASARLLAEANGLYLDLDWPHNEDFIRIIPPIPGKKNEPPIIRIMDTSSSVPGLNLLKGDFRNASVELYGYFQSINYYKPNRDHIRNWFEPCTLPRNEKDIVIHYRVGDYRLPQVGACLTPNVIVKACLQAGYNASNMRAFIVTENPRDGSVLKLKELLSGEIVSESAKHDFNFIRSFNKIICGNSSFSWWATFLGTPEIVVTFRPWLKFNNLNLWDLDGAKIVDAQWE